MCDLGTWGWWALQVTRVLANVGPPHNNQVGGDLRMHRCQDGTIAEFTEASTLAMNMVNGFIFTLHDNHVSILSPCLWPATTVGEMLYCCQALLQRELFMVAADPCCQSCDCLLDQIQRQAAAMPLHVAACTPHLQHLINIFSQVCVVLQVPVKPRHSVNIRCQHLAAARQCGHSDAAYKLLKVHLTLRARVTDSRSYTACNVHSWGSVASMPPVSVSYML